MGRGGLAAYGGHPHRPTHHNAISRPVRVPAPRAVRGRHLAKAFEPQESAQNKGHSTLSHALAPLRKRILWHPR